MKKMTLKSLAVAAVMLFAGAQSFAGTNETVYALAGNKIALTVPVGGTDTAIWKDITTGATYATPTGTGLSFVTGTSDSVMHIDGSATGSIYAQGGTTADSSTAAIVKKFTYSIHLKSAGGCISDDSSVITVYLMPNLIIPVANADTAAKYCANSPNPSVVLNATMPTLTWESGVTAPTGLSIDNFKWYLGASTTALATGITGTQNETLTVTSPNTVSTDTYKAETKYTLPATYTLVVSLTGGGLNQFSGTTTVTASAAPTAPSLSGTAVGTGF